LFETPITFEAAGGVILHAPMIAARVGGVETKLILDTGATEHVLTIDVATAAGLRVTPSAPGTDHAGASVPSWTVKGVSVEIARRLLRFSEAIAIKGPPPFAGWGIGGFLSPQTLHASAAVVLDFVANRLTAVEADEADLAAWLADRRAGFVALALRREDGKAVCVRSAVDGYPSVVTMINTGGRATEFARSALPGLSGSRPADTRRSLSGAEVLGEEVAGRMLRVSDVSLPIPRLLIRDAMPPEHPDGQIGMDLLAGTVLAVSRDEGRLVRWLVRRDHR
jgi:hypothetical protein